MIHIPTAPWYHYIGDLAAWVTAFVGARWVYRRRPATVESLARQTAPSYFVALALGAALGAWLLGSANTLRDVHPALSHSIAGALAGAIVATFWLSVCFSGREWLARRERRGDTKAL